MGQVLVKYRVMPDGPDTDLTALEAAIRAAMPTVARVSACQTVPFAFGMKALMTSIIVEDEEGNNDKVEEALNGVDGAQGVELLEMGRLM